MRKKVFVLMGVVAVGVSVLCGYTFANRVRLISSKVTTELGEPLVSKVEDFAKGDLREASVDLSQVDISNIGSYQAYIDTGKEKLAFTVCVNDTKAPEAKSNEGLTFETGELIVAKNLVTSISDKSSVTVVFEDGAESKSYDTAGTYTEKVAVTDASENKTIIEVTFVIVSDTIKPVLHGLKNRTVYIGETIEYLKSVTAIDNKDGDLTNKIEVDSTKVDLSKAGTYTVTYSVADSAGNTAKKNKKITVKKDKAPVLSGIKNRTVYVNGAIDYLKDVKAKDKRDGDLTDKIKVDSTEVNLSKAGTYTVTYSITDSAGNTTMKKATVYVKTKVTETSKPKSSSNNSSSSDTGSSSGGFKFFPGKPAGEDVNGDVAASGEKVGTW
ncbi:immunoglobulin-like domain-containing protein [Anaeromicropila populeti]|uniref:Ig-like domain (Group 3) n=1 Tax=Anaeromicropila populeti TaxID=37658 RepID=A0A1I6JFR8_9FIRM|nr:immunoglobulin-like domain-containing protein [Anaeromicropila populeti]SFR77813.1 Ig-like domain (group 3) [Anaeromicropila populeti]